MIRRPPKSTLDRSSAASDVYKRQPHYLHTPLVRAADGQKLSKQNGARPLDLADPLVALRAAGAVLGLPSIGPVRSVADWLAAAVPAWSGIIRGFADGTQPRSP